LPTEGRPREALPTEALPTEALPTEALPTEALPTEALPTEALPSRREKRTATSPRSVGTSYKAGEKASFNVTLQPKTGFHINGQFPIRFKANTPPEGVTYDKPLLKREDGKFTDTDGSFQVDFTAAKAGTYTVGGTISLSVCNEKTCTMEKVALEAAIEVK